MKKQQIKFEYKITEEALQALFQGKKVVFDTYGQPTITLYPPRYGVFMTHEKYLEIERRAQMEGLNTVLDLLVKAKVASESAESLKDS